ncbi:DUF4126 domain-containing protein [Myxococcota bacterium]|nr:DUF4126 domain-containing protein [Myxococcota bacterium]
MDPSTLSPADLVDPLFALTMGLALASTCGLRAFLPLFTLSGLALADKVTLGEGYAWLGTWPAALAFGVAVVLELVGDKFPAVDHAMDGLGVVIKPLAATLATASMITGMDPLLAAVVGLITGGVAAEVIHLGKAKLRVLSSAFTGTIGNPILSVLEDIAAFIAVAAAVLVPALALLTMTVFALYLVRRWRRKAATAGA